MQIIRTALLCSLLAGCATRNHDNIVGRDVRPLRPPLLTSSTSPGFEGKAHQKMAVIVLEPKRTRSLSDPGRAVSDTLMQALLERGYRLASRDDVETILVELDFQRGSNLTAADAAKLGRMLNVQDMLIVRWEWEEDVFRGGRVPEWRYLGIPYPKLYYAVRAGLGARMISVESAEVVWVGRYDLEQDTPTKPTVSDILRTGAKALAMKLPDTHAAPSP